MNDELRTVALVTGASAGIGEATARRLARDGYSVVLSARRQERLEEIAEEIRSEGGEALVIAGDITSSRFCRQVVSEAAAWGRLDVLVANAGVGSTGMFDEMTDKDIRQLIDVNLLGVLRTVKEAIPVMRDYETGKIVIVGSVLSRLTTSHNAVYCATKHGVVGFADSLRPEVRDSGIRVISVLPGYTDTEFFDVMLNTVERPVDAIKKKWFFHPPEAVADVISRRIRSPRAEVVVGAVNTAVVWFGVRFPKTFGWLFETVVKRLDAE